MRKLISLLVLSLSCFAASAQPTSFGGITPGTTTREELKSLVKEPDKVDSEDYFPFLEMKQPEGARVSVHFQGDVMYALEVSFIYSTELKRALIEKYGLPKIKVGKIRTVTCKNKLGGSFLRLDGQEELRWPIKNGVQGVITRLAGSCAEHIYENYELRHVATVKAVEKKERERANRESAEERRKFDGAL